MDKKEEIDFTKDINEVRISGKVRSVINTTELEEDGVIKKRAIFTLSTAYGTTVKRYSEIIIMAYDNAVPYAVELCKYNAHVYIKGVLSGKSEKQEDGSYVQKTCIIANRIYPDKRYQKEVIEEDASKES